MSIDATSVHELLELTCSSKNPSGSAGFCATRFGQARSRTSSTPCCLRYSTASGGTPRRACLRIFYNGISPRKNTHLYYYVLNNSQYIPGIQVSFKMKLRTPFCSKCFCDMPRSVQLISRRSRICAQDVQIIHASDATFEKGFAHEISCLKTAP